MKVHELIAQLMQLAADGRSDWPVFKSHDEEGNGFDSVSAIEYKEWDTFDHEMWSWDDDLPESDVVVLW